MSSKTSFNSAVEQAPTVMVLGSSGNIGLAATKMLLNEGYNVVAADWNERINNAALKKAGLNVANTPNLTTALIDARNVDALVKDINKQFPDLCLSALPTKDGLANNAALAAALSGTDYVSSNFLTEKTRKALDVLTQQNTNTPHDKFEDVLAEFETTSAWGRGLDPGLDSWAFLQALEPFRGGAVTSIKSVGAGISERRKDVYFKTWDGVTNGMGHREAKYIKDGQEVTVGPTEKFDPKNREGFETITLKDGLTIETYMNDDGGLDLVKQAAELGINTNNIEFAATLTGRHVGHCDLWKPLVQDLGLLDNEHIYEKLVSMKMLIADRIERKYASDPNAEILSNLHAIDTMLRKHGFLSDTVLGTGTAKDLTERHLTNIYQYQEGKRDRSIIYVEVKGATANGTPLSNTVEINAFGSRKLSGLTSMQKTVSGTLVRAGIQTLHKETPKGLSRPRDDFENGKHIINSMTSEGLITISTKTDPKPENNISPTSGTP